MSTTVSRPIISREDMQANLKEWSTLPHVTQADAQLNEVGEFVNPHLETEWWLLNIEALVGKWPQPSASRERSK